MDPTNEGVSRDVLDRLGERNHAFSCRMYGLVEIMSRTVFARMNKKTSLYKDLLDQLVEQMFGLFKHELDAAWRDGWDHRDSSMHQCICRDDVLDSEIVSESVLMNGGVGGDVLDRLEERKHAFSCRMYGLVDIMSRTVFARMEKRTSVYKDLLDQLVEQMFGLFRHELDAAWRNGWDHRDSLLHQCICRDDLLDSEIVSEPGPIPEQTLSQVSSPQQSLPECNEEMDDEECFEFVCDDLGNLIVDDEDDEEMAYNLDCVEAKLNEFDQSNDLSIATDSIATGDDEFADENHEDCDMGEDTQHDGDCVVLTNDDDHVDDVEAKNDDNSTLPQPSSTLSMGVEFNDADQEVMDNDSHIEENDKKDEQANHDESSVDGDINEIVQQIRKNANLVEGQVGDLNVLDAEAKICDDATLLQPSSTLPQSSPTLPQPSSTLPQPSPTLPQPSSTLSQPSSTLPQSSPTLPQSASALPQPSSTLPQPSSSLTQTSSSLTQPSSSLTQPSSTLPQSSSTLPQTSSSLPQQKLYACPRENCDRTFASRRGIRIHFDFHDRMLRLLGTNEDEIKKHARFDEQAIRKGRKLSLGKISAGSGSKEAKVCHSEHGDDRLNGLGDRVNMEGTQEDQFSQNTSSEKAAMVEKQSQTNEHVCFTREHSVNSYTSQCDQLVRNKPSPLVGVLNMSHASQHACSICGKGFKSKYHLKRHIPTHSSERPFTCTMAGCNKAFAQIDYLKIHIKNHHSIMKTFKCPWRGCDLIFPKNGSFKYHYRTHGHIDLIQSETTSS